MATAADSTVELPGRGEGGFGRSTHCSYGGAMSRKTGQWFAVLMESGETLQTSVPAQGGIHPFALLVPGFGAVIVAVFTNGQPMLQVILITVAFALIGAALTTAKYRVIGITNEAVLLCSARAFRPAKPVKLIERLSHGNNFQPSGSFWGQVQVGPERLWVHRRFFQSLADADLSAGPISNEAARRNRAKKKVKHARRRR